MKHLKLVLPDKKYKTQYLELIEECKEDIKKCGMDYFIPISDDDSYLTDMQKLINNEKGIDLPEGWVPASTFWLMEENNKRILGAITIRHTLAGYLLFRGGHISYYIRLSERRKGYARKMLSLALEECKKLQLDKVMITCDKENIGSSKVIEDNRGELHSEDIEDGEIFLRYWIEID